MTLLLLSLEVDAYQLGESFCAEFFHHLRTMHLDRALADTEVAGDCLVGYTFRDQLKNFLLAFG